MLAVSSPTPCSSEGEKELLGLLAAGATEDGVVPQSATRQLLAAPRPLTYLYSLCRRNAKQTKGP